MNADDNAPDPVDDLLERLHPDSPLPGDPRCDAFLDDYRIVAEATASWRAIAKAATKAVTFPPPPTIPGYSDFEGIGRGGFGVVYKARQDAVEGRLVAVKVLLPDTLDGSPDLLKRFHRERQALAGLNHEHILGVIDAGETDAKRPYLVLEYAAGGNLRSYMPEPDPNQPTADPQELWPIACAVREVEKLARAVDAAHRIGIVHRDLKPENVLVVLPSDSTVVEPAVGLPKDARLKIADFGLSLLVPQMDNVTRSCKLTPNDAILGTPSYLAPEQPTGTADGRADVWSLGVILYELLTGRLPFPGSNWFEILTKVRGPDEPPKPCELRPEIPELVERVCLRALQKNVSERYQSAADFADDLSGAFRGVVNLHEEGRQASLREGVKRRWPRVWLMLVVFLALVVASGVGVALRHGFQDSSQQESPKPQSTAPPLPFTEVLKLIRTDIEASGNAIPDPELPRLYFFAPHLAPEGGLSTEERAEYREALDALERHLRRGDKPLFRPLDSARTLFVLDAPRAVRPPKFLSGYPYGLTLEGTEGKLEDAFIQAHTGPVRFVRLDWFIRRADRRLSARELLFGVGEPAPRVVGEWGSSWEKRPVDLATAAVELGTSPDQVRLALRANPHLIESYGMGPLLGGGTVSRAAWESTQFSTSAFQELARILGRGTPIRVD